MSNQPMNQRSLKQLVSDLRRAAPLGRVKCRQVIGKAEIVARNVATLEVDRVKDLLRAAGCEGITVEPPLAQAHHHCVTAVVDTEINLGPLCSPSSVKERQLQHRSEA